MVKFDDLLTAKLVTEFQLADASVLREILRGMAATPTPSRGLISELNLRGVSVTLQRSNQIHRRLQHYKMMMEEAFYANVVQKQGAVSAKDMKGFRRQQKQEGYERRLRDILLAESVLDEGKIEELNEVFAQRLAKHCGELVEEYKKHDFEGVSRPLTRGTSRDTSPKLAAVPGSVAGRSGSPVGSVSSGVGVSASGSASAAPSAPASGSPPAVAAAPTASSASGVGAIDDSAPRSESPMRMTASMTVPTQSDLLDAENPAGLVIAGRFTVTKKLGEGGMGMVFLAEDEDGQKVAIKVIKDAAKAVEAVERFKREILATSFFDHENVVEIYDAGEFGESSYFMALEFVDGEDLRDTLAREKRLEPRRALDITIQIMNGMAAAHQARIIHRDLKPENVMLGQRDGRDLVKLMDFGLARILDREELGDRIFVTMSGAVSGSPMYIAPEAISGDQLDPRTDIYSIGLMLFEFIAGESPYAVKSPREFLMAHMSKQPRKMADVCPDLGMPAELDGWFEKALAKLPKHRFEGCEVAVEWLQEKVLPKIA